MEKINEYINRLQTLQNLYEIGEPQHNCFGIAINEAKKMLINNEECEHENENKHKTPKM